MIRRNLALAACCVACTATFLLGLLTHAGLSASSVTEPDAAADAAACRQAWSAAVPTEPREAVRTGCDRQVQSDLLLRELQTRRPRFTQQANEGLVLLVTVVLITLSGVALSAVQFLASYRLATQGKGTLDQGSELSIERDRITLKSSITGLFVLACSLAFFACFVVYVHPIREVGTEEKASAAPPRQLDAGEVVPGSAPRPGTQ